MRTAVVAALVALVMSACGGDDFTDIFDGGFGGGGGHAGAAGAGAGGTGGLPADASSERAGTTGGSAGAGTGGSGGVSEASTEDGDGSAQIDVAPDSAPDGAIDGGVDVSVADRNDALSDAPADVSVGSDGGADGASKDGGGDEPQCSVPNDCPALGNECLVATCADGRCGSTPVALGTPVAAQVIGDCKRKVCDGHGGTQVQNDDSDISDDLNVCTLDGCSNGTPTHVVQTGMSCGTNGVCNSSGGCVGCNLPADCPGSDDFCKARKCDNGTCGFTFTHQGTALPADHQTTGDCKTQACDGNGGIEVDPAPNDIVADSNPCTKDLCNGTTPTHPPEDPGTACSVGGGKKCDGAGSCVACLAPADCANPAGFPCVTATCGNNHQCGTSNASPDTSCGQGPSCSSGMGHLQDKCNGSGACVSGANVPCTPFVCGATACNTGCTTNFDCDGTNECDVAIHACVPPGAPKCTDYCASIAAACTDHNQEYPHDLACFVSCAALPRDAAMSGNHLGCRITHAGLAVGDPVTHCPHAGPAGDGVCGTNCESFCSIAASVCPTVYQQFLPDCATACNAFPGVSAHYTQELGAAGGDTFACRMYRLTLAALNPTTECPNIASVSPTCF
jgi:hypothetical protein